MSAAGDHSPRRSRRRRKAGRVVLAPPAVVSPVAMSALQVLAILAQALQELCEDSQDLRDALAYLTIVTSRPLEDPTVQQLWNAAAQARDSAELLAGLLDATAEIVPGPTEMSFRGALEGRFYEALAAKLLRIARFHVGESDAEDVAGDAFIGLYEQRGRKSAMDLWRMAGTVATWKAADLYRDPYRKHTVHADSDLAGDEPPAAAVEGAREWKAIGQALDVLTDKEKKILSLRLNGLTYSQVAAEMGASKEEVAALTRAGHRALTRLKKSLELRESR